MQEAVGEFIQGTMSYTTNGDEHMVLQYNEQFETLRGGASMDGDAPISLKILARTARVSYQGMLQAPSNNCRGTPALPSTALQSRRLKGNF